MAQLNPPSFCRTSPHPLRFDADTMERRRSARGAAARWGIWGGQTTQEGSRWEKPIHKKSFDSPVRKSAFWTHGKLSHNAFIGRIYFKCLGTSSHLYENLFRTKVIMTKVIMAKVNTHTERARAGERWIKELTAWKISFFHQSSYACKLNSFQLYSLLQ